MVSIQRISATQISDIVPLFNDYRLFYKMESDIEGATTFLNKRINSNESVVFGAYINGTAVGFTQLFYTFSSVTLENSLILNDFFVAPSYRNKNIGKKLLQKAQEFCVNNGYKGLALETDITNPAQKLYEQLGWKKDYHCFHYFWPSN